MTLQMSGPSKRQNKVLITSHDLLLRDSGWLSGVQWHYIIVDEGHRLKNANCKLFLELKKYRTKHKLLLTGEIWISYFTPKLVETEPLDHS